MKTKNYLRTGSNIFLVCIVSFILPSVEVKAQTGSWQLAGNNLTGTEKPGSSTLI
jgi:hypothetical protein